MIRIVIADDQSLIRDGLKTVLDLEEGLKVVATARDGKEALDTVLTLQPDVLLLDIRMPEMSGVECVKRVKEKCPQTKVIMLTTFNDDAYIIEALAGGASGYLLKDIEVEKLVEAIRDVVQGKMIMPPPVAAKLAEGLSRMTAGKRDREKGEALDLSERELEIARMMAQGFTNRQISSALYISEGTVRNYISVIYGKIGIADRTQAVLFLKKHGIG